MLDGRGDRGAQPRKGDRQAPHQRLHAASAPFRSALDAALGAVNGEPGEPSSFDRLDALLDDQSYRLAFWRVAAEEINYRRFFDITELAAVRMEDPTVFQDTHRLLMRLVGEGKIQGLRIDHPDGLRDPAAYLRQLQESCREALAATAARRPTTRVLRRRRKDPGSQRAPARRTGPSHGTTGYDFLNVVNGLFVARENEQFFDTIYFRFLRQGAQRFNDLSNSTKKMVMLISLASEVNELGYLLRDIASSDRRHRDFTLNGLTFAIREVIAVAGHLSHLYRPRDRRRVRRRSRRHRAGRRRSQAPQPAHRPVDLRLRRRHAAAARRPTPTPPPRPLNFIARFQQTTGPVMAKGTEDTAFYQSTTA